MLRAQPQQRTSDDNIAARARGGPRRAARTRRARGVAPTLAPTHLSQNLGRHLSRCSVWALLRLGQLYWAPGEGRWAARSLERGSSGTFPFNMLGFGRSFGGDPCSPDFGALAGAPQIDILQELTPTPTGGGPKPDVLVACRLLAARCMASAGVESHPASMACVCEQAARAHHVALRLAGGVGVEHGHLDVPWCGRGPASAGRASASASAGNRKRDRGHGLPKAPEEAARPHLAGEPRASLSPVGCLGGRQVLPSRPGLRFKVSSLADKNIPGEGRRRRPDWRAALAAIRAGTLRSKATKQHLYTECAALLRT